MNTTLSPKISVVMPVYNGMPYLKEAIESVLRQTFNDFELLVLIDGIEGNKDGSFGVAQSYAQRDSRVRVLINEQNLGTAHTMNKGIEFARAEIIARLDQDDVSYPERLDVQLRYLLAHPELSIVCSWEYGIDTQSRRVRDWRGNVANYGAFLGPLLCAICPIWHPSIMFHRQAMLAAGGYKQDYSPVEDFECTMRLALKGYRAGMVPEYLVGQRHHGERQSVTKLGRQVEMKKQVHKEMLQQLLDLDDGVLERIGMLLRLEPEFWKTCSTKQDFYTIVSLLMQLLEGVQNKFQLTPEEFNTMKEVVYNRLGKGVRYAPMLRRIPARVFFPAFFAFSPLLLPRVRSVAWTVHEFLQEARYPRRLLAHGLERRDKT